MINKLPNKNILGSLHKLALSRLKLQFSQDNKIAQVPNTQRRINNVQVYRNVLLSCNIQELRNQLVMVAKVSKIDSVKGRKLQLVNRLCILPEQIIQQRLKKLGKFTAQNNDIQDANQKSEGKYSHQNNDKSRQQVQVKPGQNLQSHQNSQKIDTLNKMKQKQAQCYNEKSLIGTKQMKMKYFLPEYKKNVLLIQKITNQRIMNALYDDFVNKNRIKSKLTKVQQQTQLNIENNHILKQQKEDKQKKNIFYPSINLYCRPFVNRLFKTNQQMIIQQQKRKYLYQYQKGYIFNNLRQLVECSLKQSTISINQIQKNLKQIKLQRSQNKQTKGFYLSRRLLGDKRQKKDQRTMLFMFAGFAYYRLMITSPQIVRFIFSLTFDKQLPIEHTIQKISQEFRNSSKVFKDSIRVIRKQYFLNFVKASASYIFQSFKYGFKDTYQRKQIIHQSKQQDDNFDEDQNQIHDGDEPDNDKRQTKTKKTQTQRLKHKQQTTFPKSGKQVDLGMMRFSFAIVQIGIQRVIKQLKKLQFLQQDQDGSLKMQKTDLKQLKNTHQILMQCFQIYKVLESSFTSIQINDFNGLDKLLKILMDYHQLRKYLSKNIDILQYFMRRFDRHYEQKMQLGLSQVVTQKQLQQQNFILKVSARKLNFQITDNIASNLKNDNIQISLENRRQMTLKLLERFFKLYIENGMMDSIQDQLLYTIVRYLQKQVYLDKKVKALFKARVNFEEDTKDKQFTTRGKQQDYDKRTIAQTNSNPLQSQTPQSIQHLFGQPIQSFTPSSDSYISSNLSQFEYDPTNPSQKSQKTKYYSGSLPQLLSKQLLFYLIQIIKYKHQKEEVKIQSFHGYNLIQEWYSDPEFIRLQFLREQIMEKYKQLKEKDQIVRKSYQKNNQQPTNFQDQVK